ncbi:MAG: ABC transporter ATP-binding protein [Lachnospiraceae bacterium]|nr:ABC transporter ATP-binding protein [Lachnospiraceae bacterium]
MVILRANNVSKTYNHSLIDKIHHEKANHVLKDIDLSVSEGESISIMGKSGCGKTTLLKILGTIDRATKGFVEYGGKNIREYDDTAISRLRRKSIGFVFQDYNLFPNLSVEENIMLPLIIDKAAYSVIRKKVLENAEFLNISGILKKYPYEISGGEKQRTAIARALVNDPQIILADEPTGNLDSAAAVSIMNYMADVNKIKKKALVIVTHDALVASYCQKVIFIKDGRIEKTVESQKDKESIRHISDIMLNL